jgi:hypothetical protein
MRRTRGKRTIQSPSSDTMSMKIRRERMLFLFYISSHSIHFPFRIYRRSIYNMTEYSGKRQLVGTPHRLSTRRVQQSIAFSL